MASRKVFQGLQDFGVLNRSALWGFIVESVWIGVRRVGEVHACVKAISDKEGAFAKLWSAVIHRVHFKAIHVITGAVNTLKVFRKGSNHRAGLFIGFKWRAALFGPFRNVPVMESGREQPPHVLHEEHPGLYNLYKPKELPKECPARILDGPPPASRAERLARWTANKQIKFPGFYAAPS
jgi:hypothetical protein